MQGNIFLTIFLFLKHATQTTAQKKALVIKNIIQNLTHKAEGSFLLCFSSLTH